MDLVDVDLAVLEYARKHGWSSISEMFVRAAKEKIMVPSEANEAMSTTVTNMLEFLGAYRKILIDYLVTGYVRKLCRREYREFLGPNGLDGLDGANGLNGLNGLHGANGLGAELAETIRVSALGSTNATSDYDVTLAGPGVHLIIEHITTQFYDLTHETMSFVFDSNFYTVPDLVIRDRRIYDELGIELLFPYGTDVAVPVPGNDVLDTERRYILKKLRAKKSSVIRKYRELVRLGERLDDFAYKFKPVFRTALEFFTHLFRMKRVSVEAYYGVSTVLVVVCGIQAKKLDEVRAVLSPKGFENAGLENLVDFAVHWNAYATSKKASAETDQLVFVRMSKYLQRVMLCIRECRSERTVRKFRKLDEEIEQIVGFRAAGTAPYTIRLDKYGIGLAAKGPKGQRPQKESRGPAGVIVLGTGHGFVHDAFRELNAEHNKE
jgi:hypothetical protein